MKDKWLETKTRTGWIVKRIRYSKRKPKIMKGKIYAKQFAIKTSPNTYSLIMKGTKKKW